jgi:hypothetical protein
MDISNNPVTNTAKMAVGMTVYVVVLLAAWECGTWIYRNTAPVVKRQTRNAYCKIRTKCGK